MYEAFLGSIRDAANRMRKGLIENGKIMGSLLLDSASYIPSFFHRRETCCSGTFEHSILWKPPLSKRTQAAQYAVKANSEVPSIARQTLLHQVQFLRESAPYRHAGMRAAALVTNTDRLGQS